MAKPINLGRNLRPIMAIGCLRHRPNATASFPSPNIQYPHLQRPIWFRP
ncbi:hypothetical protein CCACVL1_09444 [Corchorus capsularis]|uniref:Uncharacterized protein n=1 Tax=Corchorus capsularis TaxID=210143 RepID=A0A1R3IW56_COCAP|nr:hypothetical protein CCACVL1_09444 [Corchorus capsularis]